MKEQGVVRERDRESRQEKEKTRKRWLQARMKIEDSPLESRYLGMLPQPRVTHTHASRHVTSLSRSTLRGSSSEVHLDNYSPLPPWRQGNYKVCTYTENLRLN